MAANVPLIPVEIDSVAAARISKGNATFYEKTLMARNDVWHRIKVYRGATMSKELVLKSILQAVQPIDLIPVRYSTIGEDSFFLIRNCDNALQQLCRLHLIIENITGQILLLTIYLGYASIHELKLNIRPLLLALLTKRYHYGNKLLDLKNLHQDPDVANTVFCPLSLPRTLASVLNIAIKDLPNFEKLSLQQNDINNLTGMETLHLNITSLDLRHNELVNVDSLEPLKNLKLNELLLDGNPLCENYSSISRYVTSIRNYFPNLTKLDGVYIGSPELPIHYKNFIPNESRGQLITQFVRHYFTLYDNGNRHLLKGIYYPKSYYSMTLDTTFAAPLRKSTMHKPVKFILGKIVPDKEKQIPYSFQEENHNLLNNNSRQISKLYYGSDNILQALRRLPDTKHYLESFTYDFLFDSDKSIFFTVEGYFKDFSNEMFFFNRTFALIALDEDEYKIINDQCIVFCTSIGAANFVDKNIHNIERKDSSVKLKCFSPNEKTKLLKCLMNVTKMKENICIKYLDDAGWNIRQAIAIFADQYKAMYIPSNFFS